MNEKVNIHYEAAKYVYRKINFQILDCGHEAMLAVDEEGQTLRQMSIDLCGNASLEDRLSRWVMAARWQAMVQDTDIYQRFGDKFSPSHLTEYYKISQRESMEIAVEIMNDTLIRNLRTIEVRPVEWVRVQAREGIEKSYDEICHKGWKFIASKWLPDAYSELERKGLLATKRDRRRVRLLKLMLAEFSAEKLEALARDVSGKDSPVRIQHVNGNSFRFIDPPERR